MSDLNTSIPESVSMEDLMALSETAKDIEKEEKTFAPFDGLSQEAVEVLVYETVEKMEETCTHGTALMALIEECLVRLMAWHQLAAEGELDEGRSHSGLAWGKDYGKLQAAGLILSSVVTSKHDFTFGKNPE